MAKKKKRHNQDDAEARASSSVAGEEAEAGPRPKMKRKEYERQMRILHGELVAMQEWVKDSGAKICIVFEGRDTAGKGGTIKRITERVSPRVFRIVALPTPAPWYIADADDKNAPGSTSSATCSARSRTSRSLTGTSSCPNGGLPAATSSRTCHYGTFRHRSRR
jgi:polyphosphate kinase 2 (PPK2 family)